jgi:hypothetical protein
MTVVKLIVYRMTVYKMTKDKMTVDKFALGDMSVNEVTYSPVVWYLKVSITEEIDFKKIGLLKSGKGTEHLKTF